MVYLYRMNKNLLNCFYAKHTYGREVIGTMVIHQAVKECPEDCTITASHGIDVLFERVRRITSMLLLVDYTLVILVLGVQNTTIPCNIFTKFVKV
jgi:hypothetical protein